MCLRYFFLNRLLKKINQKILYFSSVYIFTQKKQNPKRVFYQIVNYIILVFQVTQFIFILRYEIKILAEKLPRFSKSILFLGAARNICFSHFKFRGLTKIWADLL